MKKFIALLLAVLMVLSLAAGALAIEMQESPEKKGFKKNTNDCPMDGLYADTVTLEDGTEQKFETLSIEKVGITLLAPDAMTGATPIAFGAYPEE